MRSRATTVDQYMNELPEERRAALAPLRTLIKNKIPEAAESMRYGMPYYELDGYLYALASQKQYLAFYVSDPELVEEFKPRLASLDCGKTCIRYKRIEDVPMDVIAELVETAALRRKAA